jgi:hypothetical protein
METEDFYGDGNVGLWFSGCSIETLVTPPPPDKTQEANINIIVVKLGTPN